MDSVDQQILEILRKDSKQNFRSIGEQIHMTGQAVGLRIRKLEDEGIIENYTVNLDTQKLGLISAYITLFLKSENHSRLRDLVKGKQEILETVRISGEGCYMLKVEVATLDALNALCDEVTSIANYKLNIITDRVK